MSRRAVEDFFREQGLSAEVSQQGVFELWQAGAVQVLCGDVFALQAEDVVDCVGLYDRAALIALPPEMRERYMAMLSNILPSGGRGLLVTLDYDQAKLEGPPFSVGDEEVRRGFCAWKVEALEAVEVIEESPKFRQAGIASLLERAYRLGF